MFIAILACESSMPSCHPLTCLTFLVCNDGVSLSATCLLCVLAQHRRVYFKLPSNNLYVSWIAVNAKGLRHATSNRSLLCNSFCALNLLCGTVLPVLARTIVMQCRLFSLNLNSYPHFDLSLWAQGSTSTVHKSLLWAGQDIEAPVQTFVITAPIH